MRNFFADSLFARMVRDSRLVLLYGDIGNKLFDEIKKTFPDRAINCGVAEANMVTVAAGLASSGLKPVVYTISSFLYLKAFEQIKVDVCYPARNVILVGTGGGLSYSSLGTTHHSLEDHGVLATLPNLRLYNPGDRLELSICFDDALDNVGPSWIRLGKKSEPQIYSLADGTAVAQLPGPILVHGYGIAENAVFATGLAVAAAIDGAILLSEHHHEIDVWSFPQLKPFPDIAGLRSTDTYLRIFVVEEHVPHGGLLSMVKMKSKSPAFVWGVNTGDSFHASLGDSDDARESIGISSSGIAALILQMIGE